MPDDKLEQMGRNGRRLVEERYSVEAIAQQMKELYERILGRGDKPNFVYRLNKCGKKVSAYWVTTQG